MINLIDTVWEEGEVYPKWDMQIKWDGCMHLTSYGQPDDEDPQYWHLCGIAAVDEMIARLQEAREIALKHFKAEQIQ